MLVILFSFFDNFDKAIQRLELRGPECLVSLECLLNIVREGPGDGIMLVSAGFPVFFFFFFSEEKQLEEDEEKLFIGVVAA